MNNIVCSNHSGGWEVVSTLFFACYWDSGSDYFLFKILNFAIFAGVEVLSTISMGMPILAGIFFFGMPFSAGIFLGCQFKNVDFKVFHLSKSTVIFWFMLSKRYKITFMKYHLHLRGISDCSVLLAYLVALKSWYFFGGYGEIGRYSVFWGTPKIVGIFFLVWSQAKQGFH